MIDVLLRHVLLPALAPSAIVGLYFTPVEMFGCANRGLMALAVVLVSTVAAGVTARMAFLAKARHSPSSDQWLLSTLILILPLALLAGPLG